MPQIKFDNKEEVYTWIQKFLVQEDYRYTAFPEEVIPLIFFIGNDAISIEEKYLPIIEKPQNSDLEKIKGPQKEYKYIASKLLDLEWINNDKIIYEFTFHGRIVDAYVNNEDKIILIECGSCYIPKVLEYLRQPKAEIWIITKGENIRQDNKLNSKNIRWFILKRGKNWDEFYKAHKEKEFKEIREFYKDNPKTKPNVCCLDSEEINKIIDAAKNLRDRVVLKILARTGIRRFELCNLMVKDIDFDNKCLFVEHGRGDKSRYVPLDDDTLHDIKSYLNSRKYGKLIQSNNKANDGIDLSGINEIVRKTSEKAGVKNHDSKRKNLNPHIFRHSFIRNMIQAGVPQHHVQQIVGHGDIRTIIQMYCAPEFKDTQETYEKVIKGFYKK